MAKGTVAKNNAIKAEKTNQVKAAEPKTNEKASDVLQAAKNAAQDVKTAVKESASEVKAAVTEKTAAVKEAVEEKAAAKTETVKDTRSEEHTSDWSSDVCSSDREWHLSCSYNECKQR